MLKKRLEKAISIFQWLLTVVLASVVLLLIFTAFNPIKSFQIFRVMSGSMEPAIKVGSVVFVQEVKPEILEEGNIITFTSREDPNMSITHRLIAIEKKEGQTFFRTRGDANNSDDVAETLSGQIKGKVVFSLPFLGYLSAWVKKPLGFILLVILPALLIIVSEILNIKKAIGKEVEKKYEKLEKHQKRKSITSLLVFFLLGISFFQVKATDSYFSDTEISEGNTFSVGDWTVPESAVDELDDYQNTSIFNVGYTADDDYSNIAEVRLYYSYRFGDWTWFANKSHTGSQSIMDGFSFNSPEGDGDYYFATVAIDEAGNIEDWDEMFDDVDGDGEFDNDEVPSILVFDTLTVVDTSPPVTMLSISEPRRASGDVIVNGDFETGDLVGWSNGGDGFVRVATDDPHDSVYSALIGFPETGDLPPSDKLGVSYMEQLISWSSGIPTVSLWYRLQTSDTISGSFFSAWLKDPLGVIEPVEMVHDGWDDVLLYPFDQTDLGWKEVTYQANEFEGNGQMKLYYEVVDKSEGGDYTWLFLDDVKVTTGDNLITGTSELSLFSSDASGSGMWDLGYTEYNLDSSGWDDYIDPIQINTEGDHILEYRSVDDAGNLEEIKEIDLKATHKVVINEVYYDVDGSHGVEEENEWVEIYNASSEDVDLNGWRITDNSGTERVLASSELILPSGGFAVITKDVSTWGYWNSIPAGAIKIVLGQKIGDGLANDDDRVILKEKNGLEIDAVSWGGDNSAFFPDVADVAEGHSIARKPKGIDTDTADDWEDLITPNPGTNPHILLDFYFQPEKAAVGFNIGGIGQYKELDYEIFYQVGEKQEGITGTVEINGENEITREDFTLGTCSSGGTCVYHQGIDVVHLKVILSRPDGEVILRREINYE